MATGQFAGVYRQIDRLFRSGSVAGLTEGQLLDRFVRDRDDTAFEAIVARHGAMVLGVCRANLRDPNDIDDAFQATFLVLVKKANSLHHRDLLGPWLHGVAHRVSRRARIDAAKRRDRLPTGPEPVAPAVPPDDFELRHTLHDEVNRLPESYRAAVVLCYLEGRTHDEAALELGWPVGTVRGRLARARDLLRSRLTRRGLTLSTLTLTATLAEVSEAAVPLKLIAITSRAVDPFATIVAATASPHVVALAGGVLHAMSATKLKLGLTLLVAAALTAPGVSAYQGLQAPAVTKSAIPQPKAKAADFAKAQIPPDDRIQLARDAIKTLDSMSKQGMNPQGYAQIPLWYRRLIEAQVEAGAPIDATLREYLDAARAAETIAKARAEAGQGSSLDILSARFDLAEAERFATSLRDKPRPPVQPKAVSRNGLPPGVEPHGDTMGVDAVEPRLRKFPKKNPADDVQNKEIEKALELTPPLDFAKGTPLETVLKFIRTETAAIPGFPRGIPIYLAPIELEDVNGTAKTYPLRQPVDFEGIPLRATLRLILDQHGLAYQVRDRMVYISDEERIDMRYSDGFVARPNTPVGPSGIAPGPMMPGMMMGMALTSRVPRSSGHLKDNPADAKFNAAIAKALEARVTMVFPNETPLEDVLKYIKSNTQNQELDLPAGVPIYVDPVGLKTAQATLTTPVALDMNGIPLRTTLRLILEQIGLDYRVRDALVYISDGESFAADDQQKIMSGFSPPLYSAPAPEPPAKPRTPNAPAPSVK
jgi:RNA polymerase sigma factor (sigma-70 family)